MSTPRFFNRYTGQIEKEAVYGDAALRFVYGNPLGQLALHVLIRRAFFSRWYGRRMDRPVSKEQIQPFIERYGIRMKDYAEPPEGYPHFNAFFSRPLAAGARPVDSAEDSVVFPADARHLLVPDVSTADDLFIKGQRFDLLALLGEDNLAEVFAGGAALISRLCPVDYHRYHFPLAGVPGQTNELDGPLFSVNPLALARIPGVLWRNKRTFTYLRRTRADAVICMEVGATCVGAIHQTYTAEEPVEKGAEKGYFTFGGSTVITLFQRGRVRFADDLVRESIQHRRELYARMGDVAGWVE